MSNHLTSLAYKLDVGSLLRKSVLILLADKASDDGSGIWASKQTMADELCCSKQAIINTLQQFLEEGLLVETGRKQHRNGHTITYALKLAALEALPRVKRWDKNPSTVLTSQSDGPVNDVATTSQPRLPKPSCEPSVAKATVADATDPVKAVFDLGVSLLIEGGTPERQARSLVGKWRKEHGDALVMTACAECRTKAIANPVEWLTKRFERKARYVSKSGYEYRGGPEEVMREAERRADWDTYWTAKRDRKEAA